MRNRQTVNLPRSAVITLELTAKLHRSSEQNPQAVEESLQLSTLHRFQNKKQLRFILRYITTQLKACKLTCSSKCLVLLGPVPSAMLYTAEPGPKERQQDRKSWQQVGQVFNYQISSISAVSICLQNYMVWKKFKLRYKQNSHIYNKTNNITTFTHNSFSTLILCHIQILDFLIYFLLQKRKDWHISRWATRYLAQISPSATHPSMLYEAEKEAKISCLIQMCYKNVFGIEHLHKDLTLWSVPS